MPIDQNIRHVSFDLWLTLIRTNPAFKSRRAALFRDFFALGALPPEKVEAALRETDILCNNMNEVTGNNLHTFEIYLFCLHLLGENVKDHSAEKLEEFYQLSETLFFDYAPQPMYADTMELFRWLKAQGITINLLSNTGFIQGRTLRKLMTSLGWDEYFSFQLYSDETGHSKPSAAMFNCLLENVATLYPGGIERREIWHVGDNPLADVRGAQQAGISALLADGGSSSLKALFIPAPARC